VPVHEIIYVDMDKDPNDVMFIQRKAESTKKMKGAMGISLASDSSVQYDSKKATSNTKWKLDNLRKFGNDEGMRKMDLLRAAIIGAEGTPYHDGVFFFDVCFPSTYPQNPPLVHYHSGGLCINPNLNNCGEVCLSLLWIPGTSTMLQVLVSIQAYTEGVQVGSLMRGGVQNVDEGQESCSYKFKTDVVSYIKGSWNGSSNDCLGVFGWSLVLG
ncbi:putative ubiquitin-conjugating enzyme E2, partial [Tanacetum coccineum]